MSRLSRRSFTSALAAAPAALAAAANPVVLPDERVRIGAIGVGGRGRGITQNAARYGDVVAVADVDSQRAGVSAEKYKADAVEDYRTILDRKDIDAVVIATPDHWHSKITIDAMLSGKDVYCEKPLTLTIDEGKQICQVVQRSGRVCQVGTQ
ncbi:MAG TPA: oxidoreductase, partial [Planctomycetaceae bacterium]|nr:oxidoreductase [Planctomycetaceae bacterium]